MVLIFRSIVFLLFRTSSALERIYKTRYILTDKNLYQSPAHNKIFQRIISTYRYPGLHNNNEKYQNNNERKEEPCSFPNSISSTNRMVCLFSWTWFFSIKKESRTIQFNLPWSRALMRTKAFHLVRKLLLIAAKLRQKCFSCFSRNTIKRMSGY